MDNISSPSSDDDLELGSILQATDKIQQPKDGLDIFVDEWDKAETAKVNAAARWSRSYDPDAYAKAEKLGLGIDPERGLRQMELLENKAAIAAYGEVFSKAPQMKAYFAQQPKQLAKARPDELDNISGLEWLTSAVPAAWQDSQASIEAAYAALRISRNEGTPADQAIVDAYEGGRTFGADGWFDSALVGGVQTILPIWETVKGSMKGSVLGGGAGAITGSVVPGLGTAAGAVTGATYGFVGGGYIQSWELNTGMNLLDFNKYRSEDGKKLDPEVAYTAARISGALGAMLDAVGIGPAIKAVPGAQRVISGLSKEGMKEALKVPAFRTALYNFAKNTGEQVATETTTEVLQQGVQILAGELAKANSEGQWDFKDSGEIANEMLDAGVQALQVMSLMAPFISSTRFGADLVEINRSKRQHDALAKVTAQLEGNPLLARDPQMASELIDKQLGDQKLYIPSRELVQYFQENDLDRYGPPLPNWRQRLDDALATGDDVEVSVGEFVTHLSKDPKDNPLLQLVRTDPGGYTQAEIKTYSDALDDVLLSEVEKAKKKGAMPSQEQVIIDNELLPEIKNLRAQIVNAGFKNEAADQYATMFDAFFKTLAQRTGRAPSELFQEFGVEVERGLLPQVEEGSLTDNVFNQPAFHGSPFQFDKFALDNVGSGEGNQSFGWGLYFSSDQEVAQFYRTALTRDSRDFKLDGKSVSEFTKEELSPEAWAGITRLAGAQSIEEAIQLTEQAASEETGRMKTYYERAAAWLRSANIQEENTGRLYQVNLPEQELLLDFEKPLNQQSPTIQKAFKELGIKDMTLRGVDAYAKLAYNLGKKVNVSRWPFGWGSTGDSLTPTQPDPRAASLALSDKGIPGHSYTGTESQKTNFVIYDDNQISIERFFQDNRGSIRFQEGQKAVINLFDQADMSTLLHEAGHFFLDTYSKIAPNSPELQADWQVISEKLGIKDGKITRDQHEQFARMTEAYFFAGKSPDPKLKKMFEQFRRWLKSVYQSIRKLGGSVDPEIAKVFDRMFVTDQRVEEVALDTAYAPIFDAAESMGIDPAEYVKYSELVDELKAEAQDSARERIIGQAARLSKGWRGEIQKQLRIEAEAKLKGTAPYNHMTELKLGKIKIDRKALEAISKEGAKKFPREALSKDGLDPELAAEILKYPSADEMVYDFSQALPIKEAAKQMAEQEMAARYGENFDDSSVMDLAVKEQFARDGRLTVLGTELKALSRKAGKEISDFGPKQLAREIARQSVYSKKVKDLNSYRINNQVHRASAMAQTAIVKGDWATAADWKRKQLIAQAVANETEIVLKTVAKIRDKAAKYARTTVKSVHPSYMEQIRALVENYDFAKISSKKLEKRVSLREFLDEAEANGEVTVQVPDRLLRDAAKVSYKELSAEDLVGLGDTLDNLEHLGRMKLKLRKAKELREFEQVKQETLASLKLRKPREVKMKNYTEEQRKLMDYAIEFHASLLKPEQIIEFLDSGNIRGPLMEHVFAPMTEALNEQNELSAEYNKKIMDIFESIPADYLTETIQIPGIKDKLTREMIYAAALNTGNASSRKKLLEGELWSEQQLAAVLVHMEKADWDRVQKVWNVLDGLWPKIAQLEKRLTGVAPPKIEPRAFSTAFGDYEGGYYPVVYDFKARRGRALIEDITPVDKRFANGLFENQYVRPGTNHKYTTKRTKTAKPIQLSLGILPAHIQTVIHDLTHREAIKDAYKLLWDPEIQRAIEDVEGREVYANLQKWLKSVATERHNELDAASSYWQRIRIGATVVGLGYRFTTIAAQGLGIFPATTRVPAGPLMNSIYKLTKHPVKTWEFISGTSAEMRHRMNQQDRDIRTAVRSLTTKRGPLDWFKLHAFTMIGWIDRGISSAVWLGAYNDYISKNPSDRDTALQHADRTVRLTQGTGNIKDMAAIMASNNELNKIFTMFYSGFSAQYNMQVDLYRKTKNDIAEGDWGTVALKRLPQWIMLTVVPAILGAWISGDTPEEDESLGWWMGRKALIYPTASVPFLREVTGALDTGFGYNVSPVTRFGDSIVKSGKNLLTFTDEDKEFDLRRFVRTAGEASSIWMALPTGQALSTIDNLWKGLEEGDVNLPRDLVYRRRD